MRVKSQEVERAERGRGHRVEQCCSRSCNSTRKRLVQDSESSYESVCRVVCDCVQLSSNGFGGWEFSRVAFYPWGNSSRVDVVWPHKREVCPDIYRMEF